MNAVRAIVQIAGAGGTTTVTSNSIFLQILKGRTAASHLMVMGEDQTQA